MDVFCSTSLYCGSPLERALERISSLGFKEIDLLVIDGWAHVDTRALVSNFDETVSRLSMLFNRYHVRPAALNCAVSSQLHHRSPEVNRERLRETEALLKFMSCFDIRFAAIQPRNADKSREWKEVIEDCVETLKEQKSIGDSKGVNFALEFHINSPFETLEQINYFTQLIPEMPIVYDPSHFVLQGIALEKTEELLNKAVHIHLRDADIGKLQVPLGRGRVDFLWLLDKLEKRNYKGGISIEYLETKDFNGEDEALKLCDLVNSFFHR